MKQIKQIIGESQLIEEGSWGSRDIGKRSWEMILWEEKPSKVYQIEWIIAGGDYERIGVWVNDGVMTDYDGVMSINDHALKLIESIGVDCSDFREGV